MTRSTQESGPNIIPALIYDDAAAAIGWLVLAFGFVKGRIVKRPGGGIDHAELHYRGGTVMPKSPMKDPGFARSPRSLGGATQRLYVVVDDPDAHCERARTAGAEIVVEPRDTQYGARLYAARDPEGHIWSFGTYRPGASVAREAL